MRRLTEKKEVYVVEHSLNGVMPLVDDQFTPAMFDSVKEARAHIKDIIKYQSYYDYDFKVGSYFQVMLRVEGEYENDYFPQGNKIYVK